MMQRAFGAACGLWLGFATTLAAEEHPVVVELFTSQGCSSCPGADVIFADLARQPDVLALALHVDYWDYIGWTDSFGSPRNTERQKAYARAAGSRTIYTPQMIVNGMVRVEGNDPEAVAGAMTVQRGQGSDVALTLTREPGGLRIRATGPEGMAPVRVQLVRYKPSETVTIEHGENAGRTVTYHNIVTEWQALADWTGEPALDLLAPLEGDDPAAVLLQREGPGVIVAAASLP